MTQPDPQTNDEALRTILQTEVFNGYMLNKADADAICDAILPLFTKDKEAAIKATLDRIADSVKQHTVPEGRDLVTRSYVLNTIEFERSRATGGKS
jgi:hypothetical protein